MWKSTITYIIVTAENKEIKKIELGKITFTYNY